MQVLLLALFITSTTANNVSFITLGDWGSIAEGGQQAANQRAVAARMEVAASVHKPEWVVNVGDNFYPVGVKSTTDAQWKTDFEDVYTHKDLMIPWISALGNHDYGESPQSQTKYEDTSDRWYMPSRYYVTHRSLGGTPERHATIVVLDTSPCIAGYRGTNESHWDPKTAKFHANIVAEECAPQYTWLETTLKAVNKDDWLIVVGHHPADSINVKDMAKLIEEYDTDLYLCGHEHLLKWFTLTGKTQYVLSGAGSKVDVKEDTHKVAESEQLGYRRTTVWTDTIAGITVHTFLDNNTKLHTLFKNTAGTDVKEFSISKPRSL